MAAKLTGMASVSSSCLLHDGTKQDKASKPR
jgi:hypothetical protein